MHQSGIQSAYVKNDYVKYSHVPILVVFTAWVYEPVYALIVCRQNIHG